jgi:hypothetical protein
MAEGKKTFIFYSDWVNMVQEMPNEDAGQLIKHILAYVNDQNPQTDNTLVKVVFSHMKAVLKRDLEKWDGIREKRKLYGAKGGKQTQANAKQVLSKHKASVEQVEAVNDNVNVNVNDSVNVNASKKSMEDRKQEFYNSLIPYLEEYPKQTIKDFYEYWTEHSPRQRKFRAEKEKAFDLNRRLKKWKENEERFGKNKQGSNRFIQQLAQTDEWKDA